MTREDTIRLLEKIFRLYTPQAKRMTAEERTSMVSTWHETFKEDSYDDVEKALNAYVRKGNSFIPLPGDIIKEMTTTKKSESHEPYTEIDILFGKLVHIVDVLANNKERKSMIDPGGFRWSDEYQKKIYCHAETIVSTTSFTQYDFKQLPREIQEYAEDIDGLKHLWPEIESSRAMARKRFEMALPEIRAELARRDDKNAKENKERLEALFNKMNDRRRSKNAKAV